MSVKTFESSAPQVRRAVLNQELMQGLADEVWQFLKEAAKEAPKEDVANFEMALLLVYARLAGAFDTVPPHERDRRRGLFCRLASQELAYRAVAVAGMSAEEFAREEAAAANDRSTMPDQGVI